METEFYPNELLRRYEQIANEMLQEYKILYYGDAVANAYFWGKEDENFACCFLVKKNVEEEKGVKAGAWSSVNLFDV
jgi:capping protein beta